jgi:HEAT repeat protein
MPSFTDRLKTRVKLQLAGDDLDALVTGRARGRIRWLAKYHSEPVMRFRALRNLAEMLDPDSDDLFFEIIAAQPGDRAPQVVCVAADALGRLLHGDALVPLQKLLRPNRPVAVCLAAARALARLEHPEGWAAIRTWVQGTCEGRVPLLPDERDAMDPVKRDPSGTTELAWILAPLYADKKGRWLGSKSSSWLNSELPVPRMSSDKGSDKIVAQTLRLSLDKKEFLDDEFIDRVLRLGTLSRERDTDLLTKLHGKQAPGPRRQAALMALGLQADPRSRTMLENDLEAVPDDQPERAADGIRALGRLGWEDAAPAIGRARDRFSDPVVRNNAAWSLGEVGGEQAVKQMCEWVRGRSGGSADGAADQRLDDSHMATEPELDMIARSLQRTGILGREAIRGAVTIARSGRGERKRWNIVAEIASVAGVQ